MATLRKTAPIDQPYATFVNEASGFEWRVLKVNQPKKSPHSQYATWFVAAKSPMTYGSWEYGDTYCKDVIQYGRLVSQTEEFKAYVLDHPRVGSAA